MVTLAPDELNVWLQWSRSFDGCGNHVTYDGHRLHAFAISQNQNARPFFLPTMTATLLSAPTSVTSPLLIQSGAAPRMRFNETGLGADLGNWDQLVDASVLSYVPALTPMPQV